MCKQIEIAAGIILLAFAVTGCSISTTSAAGLPAPADPPAVPVVPLSQPVVFASDRDRQFFLNIYIANPDGSIQRLTNDLADDKQPTCSPDGKQIAFVSDRDGNNEIYVTLAPHASAGVNIDGSGVTRLTNDPAYDWEPSWSPDGKRIAFTSNRDGNWEIYAMNADGANVTRLTNDAAFDWQPAWSPDGQHIAFTSDRAGWWEIYIADADGSNVTPLTHHWAGNRDPAWSPDGRRIAFVSLRDGAWEIYLVRADGTGAKRLTFSDTINQSPSWSPDGKRIAYESDTEILAMLTDGTDVLNVTNDQAVNVQPDYCSSTQ